MRHGRGWSAIAVGAAALVVTVSAAAWACVSGPAVKLSPPTAQAGQGLEVVGTGWRGRTDPVTIRFNALDGPVLATAAVNSTGDFKTTVTVPDGTRAGNYVLVASQHAPDGTLTQAPTRAVLSVVGDTGATPVMGERLAPVVDDRPAGLVKSDEISGGTLALIGLGVAGFGLFMAGMAALIASRRGSQPTAAVVRR